MANRASYGGAICNTSGATHIDKSLFHENQAHVHGGAVYIGSEGDLAVWNTTFSGNMADASGGAFYDGSGSEGAWVDLNFVTITQNQADADDAGTKGDGGGICQNDARINLKNTILADNEDLSATGVLPIVRPDFTAV